MNSFIEHHQHNIRLRYSCFDRILFNAIIQPLQKPAIIVGFLDQCWHVPSVSRAYFRRLSDDYHRWVESFARSRGIRILEPPKQIRRDEWVQPDFDRLRGDGLAVILKSRESSNVAVSYPTQTGGNRIEVRPRHVWQYYFYLRDRELGRMFVRVATYFPFNAKICVNGHEWLARQMAKEGIHFRKQRNAFLTCSDPERLQQLADGFSPAHVLASAYRWLNSLVPVFQHHGPAPSSYRLFASEVEFCTNLVFHRRAALDQLAERLLDLNRTIGRPDKLTTIFGHRVTKRYRGQLKTQIADHHLGSPVIRSDYKWGSVKQYVRDHLLLRTEATSYFLPDLGVRKSVEALPDARAALAAITDRYLEVQQDVLETYLDRGQLRRLAEATVTVTGRRIPGLKLDDPRLLALMQALTRFAHLAQGDCFRTRDLHQPTAEALDRTTATYTLAQLRYDLSKLRAKGLVKKVEGTQTYQLTSEGFRICVLFQKLFHRVYAPLTAAILAPVPQDARLPHPRRATLDRLYAAVDHGLTQLADHLGIRQAA